METDYTNTAAPHQRNQPVQARDDWAAAHSLDSKLRGSQPAPSGPRHPLLADEDARARSRVRLARGSATDKNACAKETLGPVVFPCTQTHALTQSDAHT